MVGVANGCAEFGPRALGNRSLLADPRGQNMQDQVNTVKQRQAFRPFAPVIKEECLHDYFDMPEGVNSSPFMQFVGKTKDPESFPAITHVDYSARIQTVHKETNPKYHALISKFYELTNCPVIINTSFNIRGEPIVNSPKDAFRCFMGTEMDLLVIGNCVLRKEDQDSSLSQDYKNSFKLD